MDSNLLAKAMNIPVARADNWVGAINRAMEYAELTTYLRQANFLAQIGHESGALVYTKELGNDAYFVKYEGRKDLGNIWPGDGLKFKGRGLIQVTGRANYQACSQALFGNDRLLQQPELLELPEYAALSAAWFWKKNNLNLLADVDRFTDTTRRINGGTNGLEDRKERYKRAIAVLK